jgi:hypothetical protein
MPANSLSGAPRGERFGRVLASPTGVMILVPILVIAAGLSVLWLGRRATRDASDSMARRQLAVQATDVQHDVAFALDQAEPLLASLRAIADPALPFETVASRLRDLQFGRPGIANISIAFPSGQMRGTFIDAASGELRVQQSIVGDKSTTRTNLSRSTTPTARFVP